MSPNSVIFKSVFPVTPGAKSQWLLRISADGGVCPVGRNNHYITRMGNNCKTSSRLIFCSFLHVNDGFSRPDFVNFGSRPACQRRYFMNMPLTPNRFVTQLAGSIGHRSI